MHIQKSVVISKPKREVFEYLKHIRNQDNFSVWNMKDPNQKVETRGTDGTVGFIYSWDSNDKSIFKRMLGKDLQQGLGNLKNVLEKKSSLP